MTQDESQTSPGATQEGRPNHNGQFDAARRAHETVDRVASAAHSATERVTEKSGEWIHAQDELLDSARSYVREQPVMALGVAFAVGFVLSRLLR